MSRWGYRLGAGLLVLLLGSLLWAAPPRRLMDLPPAQVDALLEALAPLTFDERIRRLSDHFLGTPYAMGPLGEGPGAAIDPDPLFRLDRVDCLTFVEQLWGLAQARRLEEAASLTQRIRYRGGQIDYRHRLHLTWSQWLPENERAGFVRDITRQVGGEATRRESLTLGPASCSGRWKAFCARLGEALPLGEHPREVLPLEQATARLAEIPDLSLLFVVLEDRSWLPYRISHVGLVLQTPQGAILRHASRRQGRVVDENLKAYLAGLVASTPKRPATGIILARLVPPSLPQQGHELPAPPEQHQPTDHE